MTKYEQLLEKYEDAYFALLMEEVAQKEGERLERLNKELQDDPDFAVSEELTKRCLKTIDRAFAGVQRARAYRVIRKVLNVAAILVALMTVLFTTAFAVSEDVRAATLNLVVTVSERFSLLEVQEPGSSADDADRYFEDIRVEWIPEGYEYVSGEYNSSAFFSNAAGEWLAVSKFKGTIPVRVDTEDAETVENIEVNGRSGLCVVKNGKIHIAITDTEYDILIDILAAKTVSRDVAVRVAENIVIK